MLCLKIKKKDVTLTPDEIYMDGDDYYFPCPYYFCRLIIHVNKQEINCTIFRHGIIKETRENIPQHCDYDTSMIFIK